jgi:hypothetical protein
MSDRNTSTENEEQEAPAEEAKSWKDAFEKTWDEVEARDGQDKPQSAPRAQSNDDASTDERRHTAADAEQAWDEVTGAGGRDEVSKLFERSHIETLRERGHTPASWIRRLDLLGSMVDSLPEAQRAQIHEQLDYWERESEVQRFMAANPKAEPLRRALGEELQKNPQRKGESNSAALARAFKAVSPKRQKSTPPKPSQNKGPKWKQSVDWHSALGETMEGSR